MEESQRNLKQLTILHFLYLNLIIIHNIYCFNRHFFIKLSWPEKQYILSNFECQ